MSSVSWTYNGNGNWNTASDWSTGSVPDAASDVYITTDDTVTSDSNVTVDTIVTIPKNHLVIDGDSHFIATDQFGASDNMGTIRVKDGSVFEVEAGTFDNSGTLYLNGFANVTNFQVRDEVKLTGGGEIVMGNSKNASQLNGILGDGTDYQLARIDNVNNTIEGSGFIGYLFFDNQTKGTIETAGTIRLVINDVQGQGFQNEGHVIADDGGTLELLALPDSSAFVNTGTFELNSTGDATVLEISDYVKLSGEGLVVLSDNFNNSIITDGQRATLENVDNTIAGAGLIWDGNLVLENDQYGTIEALYPDQPLMVDTGLNEISNLGTMGAVNGGTLDIMSGLYNGGYLMAYGGNVVAYGQVLGNGQSQIDSHSMLELKATQNSATVTFLNDKGNTGVLMLDHAGVTGSGLSLKGTVAGFANDGTSSDTIGMQDINFAAGVSWSFTEDAKGNRGTLTIGDYEGNFARIALLGQYIAASTTVNSASSDLFHVAADTIDHTAGTLVTTSYHG